MGRARKYRTRLMIFHDILDVIRREGGEAGPTRILYGANLSYERMKRYLEELKERELIEEVEVEGRTVYRLTERGMDFLREFRRIAEFARAFGIVL